MNFEDKFDLEQLIFQQRKCRVCGKTKSLMDDFYLTRKDRGTVAAAYSYECKECTKERVRKKNKPDIPYIPVPRIRDVYPDW